MRKRFLENIEKLNSEALKKIIPFILFLIIISVLAAINYNLRGGLERLFGIYGSILVVYLLAKMLLSFHYKKDQSRSPNLSADVVIPSYNEPPLAVLNTVQSAILQSRPPETIFFVDDGSPSQASYQAMQKFKAKYDEAKQPHHPELIVHRLEENQGKRAAQSWAFMRSRADVIVTVDSDCTLISNSIEEIIKPFSNEEVAATTGKVKIRNRNVNFFTRLIDMRYDNAFRVERAAQSATKNVLVCSGPLSAYRRGIILENIDHYQNQYFLGVKVQAGDDRCLTNYAIAKGHTLFQESAICYTDAPTKLKQFIKQQIRWNRSFFRESVRAIFIGKNKPAVLAWATLEMTLWIMFGFVVIAALLFQVQSFGYMLLVYYFATIAISAYARNVHYIIRHPIMYLAAPAYGILHLVLLFPLRMYALATLRSPDWGTRKMKDIVFKPSLWQAYVYHLALFGNGLRLTYEHSLRFVHAATLRVFWPIALLATREYRSIQSAFSYVYENEATRNKEWIGYLYRLNEGTLKSFQRQHGALRLFDRFFTESEYLPVTLSYAPEPAIMKTQKEEFSTPQASWTA